VFSVLPSRPSLQFCTLPPLTTQNTRVFLLRKIYLLVCLREDIIYVGFEVLMTVSIEIAAFWVFTISSLPNYMASFPG
jgi:hypothetical protein